MLDQSGVRHALQELAQKAMALAEGLQRAAPVQGAVTPSPSVQYLFDSARELEQVCQLMDALQSGASPRKLSI